MSTQATPSRQPISVFIVCCNEENNIVRCLESVRWCNEIVIVDSGSTDKTIDLCRTFTSAIYHREWSGFVDQKAYGLSLCSHEWVLNLDADEEVSPELRAEIESVLSESNRPSMPHGYELSRVVFHLGRWWRRGGWYPEFRLRLCRKSFTTWGGEDPHEKALVRGEVRRLAGELRHYTYKSLNDQVRALNSHSLAAAHSLHRRGAAVSILDLVLRPIARFVKFYFLRRGFREGRAGFIVAVLEGCYVFLKYAKLWELRLRDSSQSR